MANIQEQNEKLSNNVARVVDVTDENIVIAYRQWDLEQAKVGVLVEIEEQVASHSKADLLARKAALQEEIDAIDAFLALTK